MFRTMQTSSAACALYALGALAGAAAWPRTLGLRGTQICSAAAAAGLEPCLQTFPQSQGLPFPGYGQ